MDDNVKLELIFEVGLLSWDMVIVIFGCGVGMDVVCVNIE